MTSLKEHRKRKQQLADWYDRVLSDEHRRLLLIDSPGHQITSSSLLESQRDLRGGRYTLAVCGEMNSGKSTLLNALVFEDEILPSSPTTMTAKIARILHSTTPSLVITFYTQHEFDLVVSAAREDEFAREELSSARESFRDAGYNEADFLRVAPRVDEIPGLQDLVRYVGVPDDGGVFSPYVKEVEVRAAIPWLQDVTVTDTPGTGDPNPVRDTLTREYIRQADAVVYVTYAGQAGLNEQDVVFLDKSLLHVHPAKRLIAVNKCDGQPDKAAIRSHIQTLRNGRDLRIQALYQHEDQVVLVSGLGALISSMQQRGRSMSDELAQRVPILERSGYLDPAWNGVTELRRLVESTIIQTRGEDLLASHHRKIASIFTHASRAYATDLLLARNALDDPRKSHQERQEEIERLRASDSEIVAIGEKVKVQSMNAFDRVLRDAHERLNVLRDKASKDVAARLDERKVERGTIASDLRFLLQTEIEDMIIPFQKTLDDECLTVLAHHLSELQDELVSALRRAGVRYVPERSALLGVRLDAMITSLVKALISKSVTWETLDDKISKSLKEREKGWFRGVNEGELRKQAKECIAETLRESVKGIHENVRQHLDTAFEAKSNELVNVASTVVAKRRERLSKLESHVKADEQELLRLKDEEQRLASLVGQVAVLESTFADEVRA